VRPRSYDRFCERRRFTTALPFAAPAKKTLAVTVPLA